MDQRVPKRGCGRDEEGRNARGAGARARHERRAIVDGNLEQRRLRQTGGQRARPHIGRDVERQQRGGTARGADVRMVDGKTMIRRRTNMERLRH